MSCVSTPTATQFSTQVSSSVSTSFSELVTSLPDTTSTALITSCLSSAELTVSGSSGIDIGTCISSTVITSTTVIDGGSSTTSVPVEITEEFTTTIPTRTLFAPCSDEPTDPPTTTTSTPDPTPTPSETTEFSDTSTTVIVTPTTTFTSSSESTLEDGQVTQIVVTVTSDLPPTSSVVNTSVPIATTQANDNDGPSPSTLGAIIGGTLGGVALLLAIVGAIWYIRRRRANWDDIFEKDYEEYSGSGKPITPARGRMLDLEDEPFVPPSSANVEPKPYVYGLVGSTANPPSLGAGLASAGSAGGPEVSSHARSPSTTPLMNNAPASRPDSFVGSVGGGSGVSPTPSFAPSVGSAGGLSPGTHVVSGAGGGRTSPGPLGVQIPTGPMFPDSGSESPTSVIGPQGPLFIANQPEPTSPPDTPRPGTPAAATATAPVARPNQRSSTGLSKFSAPGTAAIPSGSGPPAAAYAYLAEKQRSLARNDTLSSASVYSQPSQSSRAPTPPPSKALNVQPQRTTSPDVVVHTDAGRFAREPSDQPPAYRK